MRLHSINVLPSTPFGFAYTFSSEAVEALDYYVFNQCNALVILRQLCCLKLFHASNLISTEQMFYQ